MQAHLSHYLHSNQPPSDDEALEIKALRVNPLGEISMMDEEIERIEIILDSLKRKRADVQKTVDDYNTILAPVRRLSMDVCGVIFTHCLATHRNPIMSPIEAPMLLTQICRDWRSIALSIPRLWSKLYIPLMQRSLHYWYETPLPTCEVERLEARSEEVQRWLRLSAACPLSITIAPTGDWDSHQSPLDAVIRSSRRWQQLELGFLPGSLDSHVYRSILSLSADDLCMLRELRLKSVANPVTDAGEHQDLWSQSGLFTAQGIRSISIGYMDQTSVLTTGLPPNWKNLNRLFIHSPVLLGLASQILSYCCNLVACILEVDGPWGPDAIPSMTLPSAFLPHLKFLSLQGHPASCNGLCSNIEAPSLRIFDCQGHFPSENEGPGLYNLLRSTNSLETLLMDYQDLTQDNVLKCYTLIPSVTRLVLGQSPTERYSRFQVSNVTYPEEVSLMTALYKINYQSSSDSAPTILLPSLEVLEAYGIQSASDQMLLQFILTRIDAAKSNTGVSKLKKIFIKFSRSRQIDIVPEALAYAHAAGIELELDLSYDAGREFVAGWSPSFGLQNDTSWTHPSWDY